MARGGAAAEFAAALGVATNTGQAWLADGLDLWVRLPQVLAGIEELRIDPWRARRWAVLT